MKIFYMIMKPTRRSTGVIKGCTMKRNTPLGANRKINSKAQKNLGRISQ